MNIKIGQTHKHLSATAGLLAIKSLVSTSRLGDFVDGSLPLLASGTGRSRKKFCDLVLGLVAGADCIDDMQKLGSDPGFVALCDGEIYSPKTYGDFLRSFSALSIRHLQDAQMSMALQFRENLFPGANRITFDCDSTANRQYGKKMQGVGKNYQQIDCLDTFNVFDEHGLQYFINVRDGGTFTSLGVEDVIHRLMSKVEKHAGLYSRKLRACWRADRGFYNSGFMNACVAKNTDFVVGVRQREDFIKIVKQIHDWKKTDGSDSERIKFYDGRECEIGTTHYRPTECKRRFRYVLMRARKPVDLLFPEHVDYDYFGFCTTYDEIRMGAEDVIKFYRQRGQSENYIKENKYGLDLKHYPCLKLDANRAYALIAVFAYNFMRFMSLAHNPAKPILAKAIRFRWINIPCQVVRTGRDVVFKYMNHHRREVEAWCNHIAKLHFEFA